MDPTTTLKQNRIRRALAVFMQESGIKLDLPQPTIAFSLIIMHKVFSQLPSTSDYLIMAQAVLFISTKIMETPMKVRDVINVVYRMMYPRAQPMDIGDHYCVLKGRIIEKEQDILRQLGFRMHEDNLPYKYFLNYLNSLHAKKNFAQTAWNILNDTLITPLCLKHTPQVIACGAIYLAIHIAGPENTPDFIHKNEKTWWKAFGVKEFSGLEDVGNHITDLYMEERVAEWKIVLDYWFSKDPLRKVGREQAGKGPGLGSGTPNSNRTSLLIVAMVLGLELSGNKPSVR